MRRDQAADTAFRLSRRNFLAAGSATIIAGAAEANTPRGRRAGTAPPIIDVHAHSQVPAWEAAMRAKGRPLPATWSAEDAIAKMDAHGVSTTILSVPIPLLFAETGAVALARAINEAHAEIRARYPGRIGAFAVLPGADPDENLAEMAYALDVLRLDGVCTSTHIGGIYMGDARFDPWFEEMNRRGTTLFIHPNLPPAPVAVGPHPAVVEFMTESTRAVMNLVYSGAKGRYPRIKMISTHGGGTVPYLAQRLAWMEQIYGPGEGRRRLSEDQVHAGLASFYYDLTAATSPAQLDALLRLVPHTKLLMGFDLPYMPERFVEPAKAQFFAYDRLTRAQKRDICTVNARALFPNFQFG